MAFAVAIALHEIFAALIPASLSRRPSPREVVTHVTIARIALRSRHTPTPPPPPVPERAISHTRIIAATRTRAVPNTTTGSAAHKETIHRAGAARPKPPHFSFTKPIWDIPVGAQGAGAGSRSGTGSLGSGGNGTGAGSGGNGSGAAAGNEPCGFVEFSDPHGSQFDPRTRGFWVDIRMTVHFPDGRADSTILDYPWYYPNEAANPWSGQNLSNPNFVTTFQPPPPDKRPAEPPIVRYVIAHSTPDGRTLLQDCPSPQSSPPATTRAPQSAK